MRFDQESPPRDFGTYSREDMNLLATQVHEIVQEAGPEILFSYRNLNFSLTYLHESQSNDTTGDAIFSQATDGTWNIKILSSLSDIEVEKRLYHLIRQCELRKMNMPLTRILKIANSETESAFM
jgi:hypothetical protein